MVSHIDFNDARVLADPNWPTDEVFDWSPQIVNRFNVRTSHVDLFDILDKECYEKTKTDMSTH
jgi:hypothetical protein